eukprot:m.84937 g.84937  ORF g.84937 m.84937 type:complete len:573 (-) comp25821_c0_seq3:107-1825(-)
MAPAIRYFLWLGAVASVHCHTLAIKPNVIAILADDYGWADAGWHRPVGYNEVQTPVMDQLVKEGIELDRQYVFKFCSPTRSAAQTGRNPIHVNTVNLDPLNYNPMDNVSGYAAVPHNMTGIAEIMKKAGYKTAFFGKWDCGMATARHTPRGRGYDHALSYFHHMEDYWQNWFENPNGSPSFFPACQKANTKNQVLRDLWLANDTYEGPAFGYMDTAPNCSVGNHDLCAISMEQQCQPYPGFPGAQVDGCTFVDETFAQHVVAEVLQHDTTGPLFLFWAPHTVHSPLQVPQHFHDKFKFIDDWRRRRYHAMVNFMDTKIGDLVQSLKSQGMYDNTIIFFSSDNGGPIYGDGAAGANNFPLKGGKASNWEGGIRVNGWVSGGLLKPDRQGIKLEGLTTIWDWYKTFASIAGVDDVTDKAAAEANLPPVDGFDLWEYLIGNISSSPRTELAVGTGNGDVNAFIWVNGTDIWKLVEGSVSMAGWTGPQCPNASFRTPTNGNCHPQCVYKLDVDPSEYTDLSNESGASAPLLIMKEKLKAASDSGFRPERGNQDPQSCLTALNKYDGFWGWWVTPAF